ncbi:GNAT family N-acetyltransferase [Kitasatospora sp. NBC_01287]|uniref:GNAT family N-acetyltransferase n=1 Tax=Kitasatospora sp. NBC_01287 TaxID=2903573 RepID=UPI00225A11A3|nr:GNAT family protein [Kitasatospora sp. NBC_01287]MCX4744476.1 GNAT family N-acetyltransferase [Kitasatospora sp. NBC_01287]
MLLLTPRLRLRRFAPADAPALAAYRSEPAIARYQGWTAPVPAAEADALVRDFAAGDPARAGWCQYALELTASGELVGDLGVCLHENLRQAELGFTLAPEHQGHGYATEAVRAVLRDLFERRGLHRVSAECDARNHDSARLLERVGFQLEGRRPEHTWLKGEWTDDLLFGLLAERWARLAAGQ